MMSFQDFFFLVRGYKSFRWQEDVLACLLRNEWRQRLTLPPAFGKTAFIDIWLYSLYHDICENKKRSIPLRLHYVVDRKLVVDQTYDEVRNLQNALSKPGLQPVSEAICKHFGVSKPLTIGRLRGGLDRIEKNKWVTTPNQPTVLMGHLVDQYGSRCLLRHKRRLGEDAVYPRRTDQHHRQPSLCWMNHTSHKPSER